MSQLLPELRHARIVEALKTHGMLRVTDLSERLGVAPVTVRRDIAKLASMGLIQRVHGGARAASPPQSSPSPGETPALADGGPLKGFRVGMLVPSLDYYWPSVIQGAQEEAAALGIILRLRGTTYEATDDLEQVSYLLDAGVDGLLLAPDTSVHATAEMLSELHTRGIPVVLVERQARRAEDEIPVESVTTDHIVGSQSAVRHLVDLGHQRVGLVMSRKSPHAAQLQQGWDEAVDRHGLEETGIWRVPNPVERATLDQIIDQCADTRTTALLVHADREAIALGQRLQERGVEVGKDMSIVSYDDEIAGLFSVPLTAVRPPRTSVGRAAVRVLHDRLLDPERPPHCIEVSPKLSVRESTHPPAQ